MYRVAIAKSVQKQLEKVTEPHYSRLRAAILGLADNPRPPGSKKLKGREGYRIRVGDYRAIYEIADDIMTVQVLAAGHRRDIYE